MADPMAGCENAGIVYQPRVGLWPHDAAADFILRTRFRRTVIFRIAVVRPSAQQCATTLLQ
jgi:hypothetical protein